MPKSLQSQPTTTATRPKVAAKPDLNPFDDEPENPFGDDGGDDKNPFAEKTTTNPFGEDDDDDYDDSLNPFAE